MPTRRQWVVVTGLLIVLLAAAYWLAEVQAQYWAEIRVAHPEAWEALRPRNPWKGSSPPDDVNYWLTVDCMAVSLVLLIPAIVRYILRRATDPGPVWRLLWTGAYLAFLLHLWNGVHGLFGGHTALIFTDPVKPPRVTNPVPDLLVALWWTFDVVLAWQPAFRPKWLVVQRDVLTAALLFSGVTSSIVLSGNDYIRFLGVGLLLGSIASLAYRIVVYPFDPRSASGRIYTTTFRLINIVAPWYRLSTWPAVFNLGAMRIVLRRYNLRNTSDIPVSNPGGLSEPPPYDPCYLVERNMDGYYNDLDKPSMGSASVPELADTDSMYFLQSNPGARFGRNVPLSDAFPETGSALLEPSPRVISQNLLARKTFRPAASLNFLAAAWIQFETHDWFNHGEPPQEHPFDIPLAADDPWRRHGCPMHIRRTRPDPTRDYDLERRLNGGSLKYPPSFVNAESHWWDGSQIYGGNHQTTARLRMQYDLRDGALMSTGKLVPDGKLFLDKDGLMLDPQHIGVALSGFVGNWWAGLSLLHTLFAREHNLICDGLRRLYPSWNGDRIFATARMINAALMAKIHTVEWTPAILAHPALQIGMKANWWGLETERLYRAIGRISENEAFSGMPLSGVDHSGADYCLTEEFVSVYRMHPLMRDDLLVLSATNGQLLRTFSAMQGVIGNQRDLSVFDPQWTMADVFYSFGRCNPGAITVHNYPNYLRELVRPDNEVVDLASIDIMRDRERGVPRYNRLRERLHKPPIRSFDDLTHPDHPGLPRELRDVYGQSGGRDNVDRLDLMVGLFSEYPPDGFGFSDTAFRIFILMASRRLKSDRFIAKDFTPDVYTRYGIDWVNDNSLISVLLRHFPALTIALRDMDNAFKPWKDVSLGVGSAAAGPPAATPSGAAD